MAEDEEDPSPEWAGEWKEAPVYRQGGQLFQFRDGKRQRVPRTTKLRAASPGAIQFYGILPVAGRPVEERWVWADTSDPTFWDQTKLVKFRVHAGTGARIPLSADQLEEIEEPAEAFLGPWFDPATLRKPLEEPGPVTVYINAVFPEGHFLHAVNYLFEKDIPRPLSKSEAKERREAKNRMDPAEREAEQRSAEWRGMLFGGEGKYWSPYVFQNLSDESYFVFDASQPTGRRRLSEPEISRMVDHLGRRMVSSIPEPPPPPPSLPSPPPPAPPSRPSAPPPVPPRPVPPPSEAPVPPLKKKARTTAPAPPPPPAPAPREEKGEEEQEGENWGWTVRFDVPTNRYVQYRVQRIRPTGRGTRVYQYRLIPERSQPYFPTPLPLVREPAVIHFKQREFESLPFLKHSPIPLPVTVRAAGDVGRPYHLRGPSYERLVVLSGRLRTCHPVDTAMQWVPFVAPHRPEDVPSGPLIVTTLPFGKGTYRLELLDPRAVWQPFVADRILPPPLYDTRQVSSVPLVGEETKGAEEVEEEEEEEGGGEGEGKGVQRKTRTVGGGGGKAKAAVAPRRTSARQRASAAQQAALRLAHRGFDPSGRYGRGTELGTDPCLQAVTLQPEVHELLQTLQGLTEWASPRPPAPKADASCEPLRLGSTRLGWDGRPWTVQVVVAPEETVELTGKQWIVDTPVDAQWRRQEGPALRPVQWGPSLCPLSVPRLVEEPTMPIYSTFRVPGLDRLCVQETGGGGDCMYCSIAWILTKALKLPFHQTQVRTLTAHQLTPENIAAFLKQEQQIREATAAAREAVETSWKPSEIIRQSQRRYTQAVESKQVVASPVTKERFLLEVQTELTRASLQRSGTWGDDSQLQLFVESPLFQHLSLSIVIFTDRGDIAAPVLGLEPSTYRIRKRFVMLARPPRHWQVLTYARGGGAEPLVVFERDNLPRPLYDLFAFWNVWRADSLFGVPRPPPPLSPP